jgi:hypothetical protein
MKEFSDTESELKVDLSQQTANSARIQPWGAVSISKPGEDDTRTGGEGSGFVRNLPVFLRGNFSGGQ